MYLLKFDRDLLPWTVTSYIWDCLFPSICNNITNPFDPCLPEVENIISSMLYFSFSSCTRRFLVFHRFQKHFYLLFCLFISLGPFVSLVVSKMIQKNTLGDNKQNWFNTREVDSLHWENCRMGGGQEAFIR